MNSQCTIYGSGISAVGSGNSLTVTVPVFFNRRFLGSRTIYMYTQDKGSLASGYQARGSWNVGK